MHVDPSKPRDVFTLNGRWEVQPGGVGVPTSEWKQRVQVPGLVDLALPSHEWRKHKYHWYRTVLQIDSLIESGSVFLTLEQSMFGTEVWLNRRLVGSDIACYTSQMYDIKDLLIPGADNELLVRVGAKETLPPESAVGMDQERVDFVPGIWGDVHITICGDPRISLVQVIPHVASQQAEIRVTVENHSERESRVRLHCVVQERRSGCVASLGHEVDGMVPPFDNVYLTALLPIMNLHLWSPDDPFLYQVKIALSVDGNPEDCIHTTFGMREFGVSGSDFLLNGRKVFLKGGNIAFHRFLSDVDRGELPWNLEWVKKALIDIPKAHNFNFFRSHIGQMYNRWYDLADEHGMLLQNEWMFWTATGTKEQISQEFTRWLQDNWNHPSIIIWDALNESSDDVVQKEIVPAMKKLDPTRPWESVDFVEQHPYIYSLGPVLNEKKFGFTIALEDLERMSTPSVVNEFLWWWLDKDWNPTILMKDVVERWLGRDYTKDDVINRQSFLARELIELFRRMRIDAIQPFVYLSNNAGPTAHWFVGHIKDLQPKPVLKALGDAFSPFCVSIELWDRHFVVGEMRSIRVFVFNDHPVPHSGTVRYGVKRFDGAWVYDSSFKVTVESTGCIASLVQIMLPGRAGEYRIRAELFGGGSDDTVAWSEKIAYVFDTSNSDNDFPRSNILVLEGAGEITRFLTSRRFAASDFSSGALDAAEVVIVGEGLIRSEGYAQSLGNLTRFVTTGGTLVLIEPEYEVQKQEVIPVLEGLALTIEPRMDADKGGYDSYVFAEDLDHPLWSGIEKKHLQMFNGGFGGEVVSQYTVICQAEHSVFARCGLKLAVEAVFEVPYGQGRVIVSRLQLRDRLMWRNAPDTFYARRPDPVLQLYLLNIVCHAMKPDPLHGAPKDGKQL